MNRSRLTPILIAAVSGLVTLGLGLDSARVIAAYNRENPRDIWVFSIVNEASFVYAGRPVSLTDDVSRPESPMVVLKYGEAEKRLRVTIPWDPSLPGLVKHEKWLRILRFAKYEGADMQDFQQRLDQGSITDRLVVVSVLPRAGTNPDTWGAAWRSDWMFQFDELLPDGTIRSEILGFPTTGGTKRPREGELQENTWQWQAAVYLMPNPASGPKHNFFGNALARVGWRLPAIAAGGVAFALAAAFSFAPPRRRD